ncbi:hypothetical protein FDECE_1327 [Fusarium decemcellulare]|nr:hypothetical protein FDECE_1327 [Fusarium decemcellulare]
MLCLPDAIVSTLALLLLLVGVVSSASDCKCAPSDPCWPSVEKWTSLNNTLSGRLIHFNPPASVCYPSEPDYNEAACSLILKQWTTYPFHSSNPASVPTVWSNESCLPIYTNGTSITGDPNVTNKRCSVGMLPAYVINATETKHIQSALDFATKWNIRVTVKNTGHNGAGRNLGYGSLSIWTHHMKTIEIQKAFLPSCAKDSANKVPQVAAKVGAGVQDGELFTSLARHNVTAVGGTNMDVGVVGWATGGGHGFMTGKYGMGADNILEVEIVTPTGHALTANKCQHQHLMTMKAYPLPSMVMAGINIVAKNGTSPSAWYQVIAQLHTLLPDIQDRGVHGYYTISGPPSSETLTFSGSLFMWNGSNNTFEDAMAPVRKHLQASNGKVNFSITQLPFNSFTDLLDNMPPLDKVRLYASISASRLMSRHTITDRTGDFGRVLEKIGPKAKLSSDDLPNVSLSGTLTISTKPVNNSLNPAWRDAVVHLIVSQSWHHSTPSSAVDEIVRDVTYNKLGLLRQLDPSSGAYLNEANVMEPDWQWSFFGPNYALLREIKEQYDPEGILWCRQCVGSEDWVQQAEGKLCRAYNPFKM